MKARILAGTLFFLATGAATPALAATEEPSIAFSFLPGAEQLLADSLPYILLYVSLPVGILIALAVLTALLIHGLRHRRRDRASAAE